MKYTLILLLLSSCTIHKEIRIEAEEEEKPFIIHKKYKQ